MNSTVLTEVSLAGIHDARVLEELACLLVLNDIEPTITVNRTATGLTLYVGNLDYGRACQVAEEHGFEVQENGDA